MISHLCDVESIVANEISQGLSQKQIAKTYALALRSSWPTDWQRVNDSIISRFGLRGLDRIKKMAWSGSCFAEQRP